MREYNIRITAAAPTGAAAPVSDEQIEDMHEYMQDLAPAFSTGPGGRLSVSLALRDDVDEPTALTMAIARFNQAAEKVEIFNWPMWTIVKAEVTDWQEFERELREPTYPTVLGVAELAELLDTSTQRASQVARTAAFPKPYAELASGPVWLEPHVRRFVRDWERKPGRPRKRT